MAVRVTVMKDEGVGETKTAVVVLRMLGKVEAGSVIAVVVVSGVKAKAIVGMPPGRKAAVGGGLSASLQAEQPTIEPNNTRRLARAKGKKLGRYTKGPSSFRTYLF
jgi:hypothetical protein